MQFERQNEKRQNNNNNTEEKSMVQRIMCNKWDEIIMTRERVSEYDGDVRKWEGERRRNERHIPTKRMHHQLTSEWSISQQKKGGNGGSEGKSTTKPMNEWMNEWIKMNDNEWMNQGWDGWQMMKKRWWGMTAMAASIILKKKMRTFWKYLKGDAKLTTTKWINKKKSHGWWMVLVWYSDEVMNNPTRQHHHHHTPSFHPSICNIWSWVWHHPQK